jgi:hypothetical protein
VLPLTRCFTVSLVTAVMYVAAMSAPAFAQLHTREPAQISAVPRAQLHGTVLDEAGKPLAGAVASALGSTTVYAVSDAEGRFLFQALPYGPYLLRVHLQGYAPAPSRLIQVNRDVPPVASIVLTRRAASDEPVPVLTAGVGPDGAAGGTTEVTDANAGTHDHGEVAWRLRHLKRSVLKDAASGVMDIAGVSGSFLDDSLDGLGRAMGSPARLATSLLADVPWNGHFDLLTSTSFDRPQDLFSMQATPRGVAYLALEAPTAGGQWTMRGAMTQADLSSWIVAGSYRRAPAAHRYEAGLSYGMQTYIGGNATALAAVPEGDRNVGVLYAYDQWTVSPRVTLSYGAKYARYDYLSQQALVSPRASVTLTPVADDSFRIRAAVSRRDSAPGAEEFVPPSTGLWLPPERTFSPLSPGRGFVPQQLEHAEVAAEREWGGGLVTGVRAFRQTVDNQIVTLFGVMMAGTTPATLGHYYVASAGDVEATGWGASVSRAMPGRVRASVDYTNAHSTWVSGSPDAGPLAIVAMSILRQRAQRMHDVTTSIESTLPVTETRVFAIYKINSQLSDADAGAPGLGARFDVQMNQSLPFLNFSGAQWEMLIAVRSLFRDDLLDASVYDELLVLRSPKRVVGGVTVRF